MRNLTAVKLAHLSVIGRKGTWVITGQFNFHLQEEKKNLKPTGLEGAGQVKPRGCLGKRHLKPETGLKVLISRGER